MEKPTVFEAAISEIAATEAPLGGTPQKSSCKERRAAKLNEKKLRGFEKVLNSSRKLSSFGSVSQDDQRSDSGSRTSTESGAVPKQLELVQQSTSKTFQPKILISNTNANSVNGQ